MTGVVQVEQVDVDSPVLPAVRQPPWLLGYVVLAVIFVVPGQLSALRSDWAEVSAAQADSVIGADLVRLLLIAAAVPPVTLIVGLVTVALPSLRCRRVEKACHPIPPGNGVQQDIQRFVARYTTDVDVRLVPGPGGLARIYPTTLRRARIVVHPPLLRLWFQDRAAAEAILLHEIAHRRQGEHLWVGVGSPFAWLLRIWTVSFLVTSVLPVTMWALADRWWSDLLATASLPQLVQDGVGPLQLMVFPVAAIWAAELAADDWAARTCGDDAVRAALALGRERGWRRIFGLLDHPPYWLRRWWIRRPQRLTLMLLTWPIVALAVHYLITAIDTVAIYWLLWHTHQGLPAHIVNGGVVTLSSSRPVTVTALLLFLIWPAISPFWPRLWVTRQARRTGPEQAPGRRPPVPPLFAGAAVAGLLVLGAALPTIPTAPPTAADEPSMIGTRVPDVLRPERMPLVLRPTRVLKVGGTEDETSTRQALGSMSWTFKADGTFDCAADAMPEGTSRAHGHWLASPMRITFTTDDLTSSTAPSTASVTASAAGTVGGATPARVTMTGQIDATVRPARVEVMWSVAGSWGVSTGTAEVASS
jgi:Zn-dependent protease with chaperone function